MRLLLCLLGLLSFAVLQEVQAQAPKVYTTKKIATENAPVIDGILDDKIWDSIEWGTDFIENEPDENTEPTAQTQFRLLYDEKFIYVAIRAFDSEPEAIVQRLSRRDGFAGDRVNVVFDSYHDLRTAFIFTVTAAGVKGDEIATDNGNNVDDSWNPIWYTKANVDDLGWTAEMKIPFSQLRFGNAKEQVWGFGLARTIFRNQEMSVWDRVPVDAPGFVSELGKLHGLRDLVPQQQLEIQPFTVTQLDTYPEEPGNPYRDGSDFNLNGGLDAKIGITNDLTLDLTVNPDFGQVEADPAAIALDGFQIFFREQRPFFVENKNIFDYQFADNQDNVFYSRRIGRSPQGFANAGPGEYVDTPQNTTILGAAKFSGKTNDGWSIGVLESVTSREFAEIDTNGSKRKEMVEPVTNYFVGRVQKDFNERNTFVGGIFTATNRFKMENGLANFLPDGAYSGGVDVMHQWKDRKYYATGNVIASHVTGSESAMTFLQTRLTHLFQREDASHVDVDPTKTSLTGTGGKIEIGKQAGGNWTYNAGFIWRSPELELNDIGFLRQADDMKQYLGIRYRTLKPFGIFRNISAGIQQFTTYDFEGNYNRIQYTLNGNASFKNNWFLNFGAAHKPRIYTNTILRGGPRWRFSEENFVFTFTGTDPSKDLSGFLGFVYSGAKEDNFSFFNFDTGITYQPTDALRVSLEPSYNYNPNKTQYVTARDNNGDSRYILGTIDNKTLSASFRLNYTVNPNLSIQYYGQPFISRANFTDFKYVTNPIADKLTDRFHLYTNDQLSFNGGLFEVDENTDGTVDYAFGNPDFSFVQFRSNLVVRWEYIPGSELFLVWSQGITGFVDPMERLLNGLENGILDQQPENIFLIKATYRFVL